MYIIVILVGISEEIEQYFQRVLKYYQLIGRKKFKSNAIIIIRIPSHYISPTNCFVSSLLSL